mmetsp:Transcript_84638/g.221031  ORF Transcript_84638/g.221031 Transcript_84638/m.221031 type:complete len:239 (+) Transcript_84638:1457-2173(+)
MLPCPLPTCCHRSNPGSWVHIFMSKPPSSLHFPNILPRSVCIASQRGSSRHASRHCMTLPSSSRSRDSSEGLHSTPGCRFHSISPAASAAAAPASSLSSKTTSGRSGTPGLTVGPQAGSPGGLGLPCRRGSAGRPSRRSCWAPAPRPRRTRCQKSREAFSAHRSVSTLQRSPHSPWLEPWARATPSQPACASQSAQQPPRPSRTASGADLGGAAAPRPTSHASPACSTHMPLISPDAE